MEMLSLLIFGPGRAFYSSQGIRQILLALIFAGFISSKVAISAFGASQAAPTADQAPPPEHAPQGGVDVLRVGDTLTISYSDFPGGPIVSQQQIREDGKVTLHLGYEIKAAGENRGELEKKVRKMYVDEKQVYRDININISAPLRYFSVGGEVRTPGSFAHPGEVTLTKAINAAGGLTDYANKRSMIIIRASDRSKKTVNYNNILKNPQLDEPIYPGDQIHVKRSIF